MYLTQSSLYRQIYTLTTVANTILNGNMKKEETKHQQKVYLDRK